MGGLFRGLNLQVNDRITRPTGVLLKRKVFDARQRFDGVHFYDLCAGSGAVGLEASSRGAESVTLVEENLLAIRLIKSSVDLIKKRFEVSSFGKIFVVKKSVVSWLPFFFASASSSSNIVFFDPPYEDSKLYDRVLDLFELSDYKGELWIEYDLKAKESVLVKINDAYEKRGIKKYTHGQHSICLLQF